VHEAWCDNIGTSPNQFSCLPLTFESIDFTRKVLKCTPATPVILASAAQAQSSAGDLQVKQTPAISTTPAKNFEVPYDKLVIAVGAYSQSVCAIVIRILYHSLMTRS
jgi:hypothetical protein